MTQTADLSKIAFSDNPQPMWIFSVDDFRFQTVNEAAIVHYGYSADEFSRLTITDIRPESERQSFRNSFTAIHTNACFKSSAVHQDRHGRVFSVELFTYPVCYNELNCRLVVVQNLHEAVNYTAELSQKAAELQYILDSSLDVICAFDGDGRFTQCSKASLAVWGYHPYELIGRRYSDFVVEADLESTTASKEKVIGGLEVRNFQNRYRKRDGSIIPIEWSARWDRGRQQMFCIARDATEKVLAERVREEHIAKMHAILESVTDGFLTVDKQWTVTYWNAEAEQILRMPRESILHKNLWEVYSSAVSLKFYSELIRAARENVTTCFEEYFPPLDIWIESTAYPSDEGLSIYFRDITERKAALMQLKESKERYDVVTKATNDIIWDWDLITDTIHWNTAFELILGFENNPERQTGDWWIHNVHPDDYSRIENGINEVIARGGNWNSEYRFKCGDGSYKYFCDRGFMILDETGKGVRMIGSMQDITSLKAREAELEEKNARLLEIAHVNSHGVRKPLANILGLVEAIGSDDFDNKDELLGMLKDSGLELDEQLKYISEKARSFGATEV